MGFWSFIYFANLLIKDINNNKTIRVSIASLIFSMFYALLLRRKEETMAYESKYRREDIDELSMGFLTLRDREGIEPIDSLRI